MKHREYDVIVIGAGPVGENVADRATAGGLSVVIVEEELVGGECSYWACVPSKALLRPGAALSAARAVAGADAAISGSIDAAAVLRRRDDFVGGWNDDAQERWLAKTGIDLVRGHGRITGVRTVAVERSAASSAFNDENDEPRTPQPSDRSIDSPGASLEPPIELRARHAVVVCTGTDAAIPDIDGLAKAAPWTSREATSAAAVPPSLAVIGGGTVACEMATVFRSLGSEVTMLVRGGILSNMEPFAGAAVLASLRASGVTVHTGVTPIAVRRVDEPNGDDSSSDGEASPDGSRDGSAGLVEIRLSDERVITASEVLVATGRTPRTGNLGLDTIGLEPGSWLTVDDTLRVLPSGLASLEDGWLYAVGDVNHRALLTHQGKYQARIAGDVIAARAQGRTVDAQAWGVHAATADHVAVPQVTFTDPEVASVGLTAAEAELRAKMTGSDIRVIDYDLTGVSGATLHRDGYAGQVRALIDADREVLLGMTVVGPDVAELLHAATIAITAEVPLRRLWHAVPAFPTISEMWLRLLEEYGRPQAE